MSNHAPKGKCDLKTCTKCKVALPATAEHFHRDRQTRTGLNSWCKPCSRQDKNRYRYENYDIVKERKARGRARPEHAALNNAGQRRYAARHPEKIAARKALNNAIKRKEIVRQPCQVCGVPNAHAHHHDYSKPFDVEWMCRDCHMKEHRRTPEGIAALRKASA